MFKFSITSITFFAFILLSLAAYYIFNRKKQWVILLICSLLFIFFSSGPAVFIFIGVDLIAVYCGTVLTEGTEDEKKRRLFTASSIVAVVAVLFMLKYWNNVADWSDAFIKRMGLDLAIWRCEWAVPVGISYFSLSSIGYILDVNWRSCKAERNIAKLALMILWFPTLICGPVTRFSALGGNLFVQRSFDYEKVKFGAERMLYGLFKKLVVANRIGLFTGTVFTQTYAGYDGAFIVVAALLYAFQIYADFSGCMDIMLGVSEMFQVTLPENFRRPFFSQSLSEFWRRWHITLGQWAKDYVMYPLLKSRALIGLGDLCKKRFGKKAGKKIPTYLGMLALWLVLGVWHGASFKAVFSSGILLWLFIFAGQIFQPVSDRLSRRLHVDKTRFSYKLFASLRTLFCMCVTWIFFNAESVSHGFWMVKNILLNPNIWILTDGSLLTAGLQAADFNVIVLSFIIVLVISVMQERGVKIRECLEKQGLPFRWLVLLCGIFAVIIFGVYGPKYNAADFIYKG